MSFIQGRIRTEVIYHRMERLARKLAIEVLDSPSSVKGGFVLYLRQFPTDHKASKFQYGMSDVEESRTAYTEEELLCLVMRRTFGQVVALGDPKEKGLPPVGAQRLYASDNQWRDCVKDLAPRASLVIIQLNEGRHVQWELEYASKNVSRDRIVLLIPRKIHDSEFLANVFKGFLRSPSLIAAYAHHVGAIENFPEAVHGAWVEQTEYFSVICFDSDGFAYHDSVYWEDWNTAEVQNLAKSLGLQTLFSLNGIHDRISLMGGHGCCGLPLTRPHLSMHCKESDLRCATLRSEVHLVNAVGVYPRPVSNICCPLCFAERVRGLEQENE
ncbi:hypothetical protein ACFU9Y_34560 [Streptomyces sp. NPDC057621]|uniref:hypothetical protein n=1 Tax=Streptomyces sp. NPDC057621 TaxID=3346186 RepID=UPI00368AD213